MDYKQIIERLSLIRTRKNLSSREFGQMLGNSDTYFYKIEDKSIILNVPKLLEVLETLEIDTEEFFYEDFENYKEQKELIENYKKLSNENKETIKNLINKLK